VFAFGTVAGAALVAETKPSLAQSHESNSPSIDGSNGKPKAVGQVITDLDSNRQPVARVDPFGRCLPGDKAHDGVGAGGRA
jgi:hypothetical protein